MATETTTLYPDIHISLIKDPYRLYAFPFLGGLAKIIMLIPVGIWITLLGIAYIFISIINSFFVLFTGTYWKVAYELGVLLIHLSVKVSYFFAGLTNTYPGFDGTLKDFTMDIPYPQNPNRLFAIPILGGVARFVLLIPYFVYTSVIQYAANIGTTIGSFFVLFQGRYPESAYEIARDSVRLNQAFPMYMGGFSDTYPSWWISMNHKTIKIILIIIAILFMLNNYRARLTGNNYHRNYRPYHYNQTPTKLPSPNGNTVYKY